MTDQHEPGAIVRIQDPADANGTTTAMVITRGDATSRIQYAGMPGTCSIRNDRLDALPPGAPDAHRHHTAVKRCRHAVDTLSRLTGIEWTFGYIGNCSAGYDDREWFAFAAHPGRVGTRADRIGGVATADLPQLAVRLAGAAELLRLLDARGVSVAAPSSVA